MRTLYLCFLILPCLATGSVRAGTILFIGDSLTAGYGLAQEQSYPARIAQRMKADGFPQPVVNAGVSGDTSAGGLRRVDWLLREPIEVLVLALGANDGLRGVPASETEKNLRAIMERVRAKNPNLRILLAGMKVPPNMGARYAGEFEAIFPRIARDYDAVLMPFLLEGVAGQPHLNQEDGIHPTAEGQQRMADELWKLLKPLLSADASTKS